MAIQPSPVSNTNLLALPDGTELVGDYRIKRVLGAGGFGITYLADEIALARLVTIKEYFPAEFAVRRATSNASPRSQDCAEDYKWGLERFLEEAQTLARFEHPNIVRVYRYFRANNTGYMVLRFEEGGSFKAWLRGLKRAPRQPELDKFLTPLLEALDVVHAGDFLHRDIAPDNIIIRKDGSPVLIDFGSARGEIASHSKTVSALVKPGYSPYEQYATTSRQQGPWTDIYALGATLYHAVTGKRVPDAPSRMVSDEYVPARAVALSSYRPGFLAAIDKALRLEVGERPQSIAQWREQLLAPEPKRERGRLGLGRALDRLRTGDPARAAAPQKPQGGSTEPLSRKPDPSPVPAPPDTPQPKGQLLDFIDALKKRRSGLAAQKATPDARPSPAAVATPAASRQASSAQDIAAPVRGQGSRHRGQERPASRAGRAGAAHAASAPRPPSGHPVAALALAALQAGDRAGHCRRRRRLSGQAAAYGGARRRRRVEPGHRPVARHTPHGPRRRRDGPRHRRRGTLDRVGRSRRDAAGVERRAPACRCAPSSSTTARPRPLPSTTAARSPATRAAPSCCGTWRAPTSSGGSSCRSRRCPRWPSPATPTISPPRPCRGP